MHAFPVPAVLHVQLQRGYHIWYGNQLRSNYLPPPPPVKGVPLTNWGRHQKIKKLIGGYVLAEL